jgi:hypothetical protein
VFWLRVQKGWCAAQHTTHHFSFSQHTTCLFSSNLSRVQYFAQIMPLLSVSRICQIQKWREGHGRERKRIRGKRARARSRRMRDRKFLTIFCDSWLFIFYFLVELFSFFPIVFLRKTSKKISFMPAIASTSGRLHNEFIRLLLLQAHRETDRFFPTSRVYLPQPNRGLFHFHHPVFSDTLKVKDGNTLSKTVVLRVNLNVDGVGITSKTHTHPSHSETSRLLTSSSSLGVKVPQATQCIRCIRDV